MEQVVERGTATFAQIDGYTIAGKDGHVEQARKWPLLADGLQRLLCRVPAVARPVVAIIVVLDSPHALGHFGGPIAGPIFQKIAQAALRHLG
jgi:cell division protein FtsI (penicillin-binding protein 3)